MHTYSITVSLVRGLFFQIIRSRGCLASFPNNARFLWLLLDSASQGEVQMAYCMSSPSAFEICLHLHVLIILSGQIQLRKLSFTRDTVIVMTRGLVFQVKQKAWKARALKPCVWWFIHTRASILLCSNSTLGPSDWFGSLYWNTQRWFLSPEPVFFGLRM